MFDRALSSDEVVDEMKRELWLPGQAEHTLASGAVFPEEQRQFPIIGLGSVAQAPPQLVVGQWLVCRLPVPGCPLLSLFLPMIFLGVFL